MEPHRSRQRRRARFKVEDRYSVTRVFRLQCRKCSKRLGLVWLNDQGQWDGADLIGQDTRGTPGEGLTGDLGPIHHGNWIQFRCPGRHKQKCGFTWQGRDSQLVALIQHAEATGSDVVILRDVAPPTPPQPVATSGGTRRF